MEHVVCVVFAFIVILLIKRSEAKNSMYTQQMPGTIQDWDAWMKQHHIKLMPTETEDQNGNDSNRPDNRKTD